MHGIHRQFFSYLAVAAAGYLVDFGTMVIAKEVLGFHYLISATIGFLLGLIVVYALSSKYVFSNSKIASKRNEFIIFALIGIVGLVLLNLIMWVLTSGLSVSYLLSKVFATIIVYLWNFFARRAMYHN